MLTAEEIATIFWWVNQYSTCILTGRCVTIEKSGILNVEWMDNSRDPYDSTLFTHCVVQLINEKKFSYHWMEIFWNILLGLYKYLNKSAIKMMWTKFNPY